MRTSILLSAYLIANAINSDAITIKFEFIVAIFLFSFIMMDLRDWKQNNNK